MTGRSRLTRRLTTILPPVTLAEVIETTRVTSVASVTDSRTALVTACPFRALHHTVSTVGLHRRRPDPHARRGLAGLA
jgi:magnesium chelatase family protein